LYFYDFAFARTVHCFCHHGVDLISDALTFDRVCCGEHETIENSSDGVACAWVGFVDRVEQRRNIRSRFALAQRIGADYPLCLTVA
jgi:hypothetical protein